MNGDDSQRAPDPGLTRSGSVAGAQGSWSGEATLHATLSPTSQRSETFPVGATLLSGRYELIALLGQGGMGSVYRAHDRELGEDVALKVIHADIADSAGTLDRFRQEVKLARRVTHRSIARMFDIGEDRGMRFLTMEYIDGESVSQRLARQGRLTVREALDLGRALGEGLAAAHAAGVVHRDLKPDNVLLGRDGRVVITDFGIARVLASSDATSRTLGRVVGTPAYMAPEQVEAGGHIDGRTDLYALGLLLFEALVGERAFPGEELMVVVMARMLGPAPTVLSRRPDVPPALSAVVARCTERRREDRFASADEFLAALAQVTSTPSVDMTAPALVIRPPSAQSDERTVAVMTLRGGADAVLAEEVTEQLVDALSMTRGLKVRANAGSVGAGEGPLEAGRRLGVQAVVHGTVRRDGDRIALALRLLGVDDGFQLWSKRSEIGPAELLREVDEVAAAVAKALKAEAQPAVDAPSDPRAIELLLRARHVSQSDATAMPLARQLMGEALALAPSDPRVLASHAWLLARDTFLGDTGTRQASIEMARRSAERAITLAPQLGDSWVALGAVRFYGDDDIPASVTALRRAVQLAPSAAEPHEMLGRILAETDLLDDAIAYIERAIWISPEAHFAVSDLARLHALRGDWDLVEPLLDELVRRERHLWAQASRGRTDLWRHRTPGPFPATVKPATNPWYFAARLFWEVGTDGGISEANRQRMEQMLTVAPPRSRAQRLFLQICVELWAYSGDEARAQAYLEQAVDAGLADLTWMRRMPLLDPLRSSPSFAPLLARVEQRTAPILAAYRAPLA